MTIASLPIAGGAIGESGPGPEVPGSAPTLQALLDSGDYVIAVEISLTTIGSAFEHILVVCGGSKKHNRIHGKCPGFTTLASDTPPLYEVAPILEGEISIAPEIAITETTLLAGGQDGEVRMIIPNTGVYLYTVGVGIALEPLSLLQAQRQCGGRPVKLKIGRPEFGYASFHTVVSTFAEALELDGATHLRLRLRDYTWNLDQGLLDTWAGTGGQGGTAELTGEVRRKHYGAPRNVTCRLMLPATLTHHISDRTPSAPVAALYDGGVALVEDATGYPFASWSAFQAHTIVTGVGNTWVRYLGQVRTRVKPSGVLTADMVDVMTVPGIIRAMMQEAGVAPTSITFDIEDYDYGVDASRSEEWQAVAQMLLTAPAQQYIADQEHVIAAVDRLAKSHGLSRIQSRDGSIRFVLLDYRLHPDALAGTDYFVVSASDHITITPQALPSSLWPPRCREFMLADQNHTVMTQDQILPAAADAFRQMATVAGRTLYVPDVTPASSPIKAALPMAVDPPRNDTALVDPADAQVLAEWFQSRSALTRVTGSAFLSQRRMFRVGLPLSLGYGIPPMSVLKFRVPNYWPDSDLNMIGQMLPATEKWSTSMMEFDFYPYGHQHPSVFMSEIRGPVPNTSMYQAYSVFVAGGYAYVACSGRNSLAIIDVSTPTAPVWVTEVRPGIGPLWSFSGPTGVCVSGSYAFVACNNSANLVVVDVSNPMAPVDVASVSGPVAGTSMNGARVVVLAGGYAYVACFWRDSLAIIDVSTPTAPVWVTEVRGPNPGDSLGGAESVFVSGGYAYLACFDRASLAIIDVSTPTAPVWVTEVRGPNPGETIDGATGVFTADGYAYVANVFRNSLAIIG